MEMIQRFNDSFKRDKFDDSPAYLLSQELEYDHAKSFLTFSITFIGGIVTLKTALNVSAPIEDGFLDAVVSSLIAGFASFSSQQSILEDLRQKRAASPFVRVCRRAVPGFMLGIAFGSAIAYFV